MKKNNFVFGLPEDMPIDVNNAIYEIFGDACNAKTILQVLSDHYFQAREPETTHKEFIVYSYLQAQALIHVVLDYMFEIVKMIEALLEVPTAKVSNSITQAQSKDVGVA